MSTAVALVGAGPGSPDLLTLRAEELLSSADVVVVDAAIRALAEAFAPRAEIVAVPGGAPDGDRLVAAARRAGALVRLYRGDPWLHPAYGAERAALDAAGVPCEAVAGVAVEVGVPALAGVPVHVRHLAVTCTLGPFEDLPPVGHATTTFVASGADPVAMVGAVASTGDPGLAAALIDLGAPERAWRGPLGQAAGPAAALGGPALLVVGAVCRPPVEPASRRTPGATGA